MPRHSRALFSTVLLQQCRIGWRPSVPRMRRMGGRRPTARPACSRPWAPRCLQKVQCRPTPEVSANKVGTLYPTESSACSLSESCLLPTEHAGIRLHDYEGRGGPLQQRQHLRMAHVLCHRQATACGLIESARAS